MGSEMCIRDSLDLWDGPNDVYGWVARQGTIKGLDLVDFNYPQHLQNVPVAKAREALERAGLTAGSICMRYPKDMQLGAFTNPDPELRRRAIDLTKEAGQWARDLGAQEVVVWSAFDGYDYNHQVALRSCQGLRPRTTGRTDRASVVDCAR